MLCYLRRIDQQIAGGDVNNSHDESDAELWCSNALRQQASIDRPAMMHGEFCSMLHTVSCH